MKITFAPIAPALPKRQRTGGGQMRALIVVSSKAIVKRPVTILAEVGELEMVGQAGTVAKVSPATRNLKPDLIVLDIRMRGGNRLETPFPIPRHRAETTYVPRKCRQ
jgi:DNA-binding NarL/FixJ family response regulator